MNNNISVKDILGSLKEMINNRNHSLDNRKSNEDEEVLELVDIAENKNHNNSSFLSSSSADNISGKIKEFGEKIGNKSFKRYGSSTDKTIEDFIIELMKPYLQKWLDENLPGIVEKVVEKEIKQLIPKEHD